MKIADKISSSFLVISLLIISASLTVFYLIERSNLQSAIYDNLTAEVYSRANHIETYLEMLKISVGQLSKSETLEIFLQIKDKKDPRWNEVFEAAMRSLKRAKESNPSVAEFLIADRTGRVLASSDERSIGSDKSTDAFFVGGQKKIYVKDVYHHEPRNEFLLAVSAPLLDSQSQEFLGVLAARIKLEDLNNIVKTESGLGAKGEIFIVNKYDVMITPSRFEKNTVLRQKVDSEDVRLARLHKIKGHQLSADKRILIFSGYRGVPVLGACEYIPQMSWVVLAEMDQKEAFRPLARLRRAFFGILLITFVAAWLLGKWIAWWITGAIHQLHMGIEIIGRGNLNYRVSTNAKDEVGKLSRAFDAMIKNLAKTTISVNSLNKEIVERKKAEENLNQSLEKEIKSRQIVVSMLADNNQVREKLEQSVEAMKKNQQMLVQSEKLASIGQLAAGVAHEINNPIAFIGSNLATLEQYLAGISECLEVARVFREAVKHRDAEKAASAESEMDLLEKKLDLPYVLSDTVNLVRESREGVQRVAKIVSDLKTFARVDSGATEQANLNDVLEGALTIVWNEIKYKAEVQKEYGQIPLVQCNPQQITQVFINLLVNAVQSIEKKGEITLRTYADNGQVCAEISDTGCGIPDEIIGKIFDPFFTTKPVGQGTGLGLGVSYDIAKKNGGAIDVTSKVGEGTTFTVSFPISPKGGSYS